MRANPTCYVNEHCFESPRAWELISCDPSPAFLTCGIKTTVKVNISIATSKVFIYTSKKMRPALVYRPSIRKTGRRWEHQRHLSLTHSKGHPTRSFAQIVTAKAHPPTLSPLHGTCLSPAVAVSAWVAAVEWPGCFARLNLQRVGRLFKNRARETEVVLLSQPGTRVYVGNSCT